MAELVDEDDDDDEEDADPFEQKRYLARRGVDIEYMETVGVAEDTSDERKVMFKGQVLRATQLHQVWEIVPVA